MRKSQTCSRTVAGWVCCQLKLGLAVPCNHVSWGCTWWDVSFRVSGACVLSLLTSLTSVMMSLGEIIHTSWKHTCGTTEEGAPESLWGSSLCWSVPSVPSKRGTQNFHLVLSLQCTLYFSFPLHVVPAPPSTGGAPSHFLYIWHFLFLFVIVFIFSLFHLITFITIIYFSSSEKHISPMQHSYRYLTVCVTVLALCSVPLHSPFYPSVFILFLLS